MRHVAIVRQRMVPEDGAWGESAGHQGHQSHCQLAIVPARRGLVCGDGPRRRFLSVSQDSIYPMFSVHQNACLAPLHCGRGNGGC